MLAGIIEQVTKHLFERGFVRDFDHAGEDCSPLLLRAQEGAEFLDEEVVKVMDLLQGRGAAGGEGKCKAAVGRRWCLDLASSTAALAVHALSNLFDQLANEVGNVRWCSTCDQTLVGDDWFVTPTRTCVD